MPSFEDAAGELLANRRIAVTGVSRQPDSHGGNVVYKRLRERGYEVFAVNPNADQIEGDRAYHGLRSIAGGVHAVVIATRPEAAEETMRECADLGINHVWMRRSFGAGSVSDTATGYGRERGITVIDGSCPCVSTPPPTSATRDAARLHAQRPRPDTGCLADPARGAARPALIRGGRSTRRGPHRGAQLSWTEQ
jgi:predicted CoA-binding protein